MAHYAFLDDNNIVTEVIVGIDETELIEGNDPEIWYGEFKGQTCKRTSYNAAFNSHKEGKSPFRGNYAGIGYTYDSNFDVFIPPRPFPSWKLNYNTYTWEAPSTMPDLEPGIRIQWSEINQEWVTISVGE